MDLFKGSISQDDQIMNLPLDTDRTRGDNPVRNPLELTGMTGPGPMSLLQRELSTVAKGSRAQIVLTEPRRCPATGVEVEGTVTDTRANIPYRCCDCGIRMTTGHNSVMTEDKDKEPSPIRTYPVKTECAPIDGETVILRPMNLLDVPALRLPGVFLKLAEEARNSEVVDDQPSGMSAVKSHRSGQAGRVMITEIIDSFPILRSGASRVSQTSTEVIPDLNLVEPVIRLGPVGHLRNTEQPIMLSVKTNQGTISPPGPVGQHVLMAGHMEMMIQPDPVGPYEETEPSVSQGTISPPGPVGQHVQMAGHMEMMVQPDPVVPLVELVFRSQLTIMDIHGRADVRFEELHESDGDGDSDLSDYYCRHKSEDSRDWQYNKSAIMDGRATYAADKLVENADNAEGHDLTLGMEIEDKIDVCSEPDARAKFELSPTKHVVALDNIGVNCIANGDVTVIRGNIDGDSDTHEDEFIKVSMISVDEIRRGTSEHIHNSLWIRDCVIPECVTQSTLVAYGDSALCNKESLQIMMKYCFGLCGLTNQFRSTDFEWCVECVNRLIWGFLVSCVVSIVMRNRSVGTDVFSKGSDVFVSIWGLVDGLVILCDAMRECLWRLKDIKDTLNNVMLGNRAKMISHYIPWGEDNGQVRATRSSVDISPIWGDYHRRNHQLVKGNHRRRTRRHPHRPWRRNCRDGIYVTLRRQIHYTIF